jgi:2-polyprenyl-3-methyl-5-hydroxy-6-metoxy-1,4-benzoquinol methylase
VSATAKAAPFCGLEEWIAFTQDRKMNHSEMLRYYGLLALIPAGVPTVLDAGCGKGYTSYLMSREGYRVHAVDLNTEYPALFAYAPPAPFDLVLSQEVLEHIPNYADALKRLAGCVGPGGWGLFCVPYKERLEGKMITDPVSGRRVHKNGHLHSFDPKGFTRTLDASGFRVVKMRLFTNKRLLNWMGNKKRVLSRFWTGFDQFMNHLSPHRANYMAFLVQKR